VPQVAAPELQERSHEVITLASRKGARQEHATAHLAPAHSAGHRCLVIDADRRLAHALHSLRADGEPRLQTATRGIDRAVAFAMIEGSSGCIDTAPTMWVVVQEAIRAPPV